MASRVPFGIDPVHTYSFTRWRKFGHDWLYIADAAGTTLGHVDLATRLGSPEPSQDREHLELLAKAWQQNPSLGVPAAPKPSRPKPAEQSTPETPAFDLACYPAGHAARSKAQEERERIRAEYPVAARYALGTE